MAEMKVPKNLAQCADLWFKKKQERLALQKQVDALASEEAALETHIINNLDANNGTAIGGKLVKVEVKKKERPVIDTENNGWALFWEWFHKQYKKDPRTVACVQKRLAEDTIKDLWAEGVKIPGVVKFNFKKLSFSAIKQEAK